MEAMEKIMNQLDRDEPNWFIRWGTGSELEAYALYASQPGAKERLRKSVANRVFARVISAAIAVGLITDTASVLP